MKKKSFTKGALAVSLAAVCAWGLVGCSSNDSGSTGGVAATVNGVEISEDKVTATIESARTSMNLTDEESWGQWMAQYNYTPESVREEILDSYINQEVLRQSAGDRGVSIESSEIDSYVDKMKSNYASDDKWQAALSEKGLTEESYRENIEMSLLYTRLMETFATEEASDEDLLAQAQVKATTYNGAKRSSHVLFEAGDEETAQSVLDQLNAGTIDIATAAAQYSKDTSSAVNGGDVGWDKMTSFVTEYQDALDALEVGQLSGLVTSQFGIHIIMCTDEFIAPDELTSIDQLPTEMADEVRQSVAQSEQQQAYADWLEQCRDAADIVINDLPQDVSYNLDMSKYATSDDDATSDEVSDQTDASTDDQADDGETAIDDSAEEKSDGAQPSES